MDVGIDYTPSTALGRACRQCHFEAVLTHVQSNPVRADELGERLHGCTNERPPSSLPPCSHRLPAWNQWLARARPAGLLPCPSKARGACAHALSRGKPPKRRRLYPLATSTPAHGRGEHVCKAEANSRQLRGFCCKWDADVADGLRLVCTWVVQEPTGVHVCTMCGMRVDASAAAASQTLGSVTRSGLWYIPAAYAAPLASLD